MERDRPGKTRSFLFPPDMKPEVKAGVLLLFTMTTVYFRTEGL